MPQRFVSAVSQVATITSWLTVAWICREQLPLEYFGSVLILASGRSDTETGNSLKADVEATDSESLACLLRIRDIVARRVKCSGKSFPKQELISEILDSRTKELVERNDIAVSPLSKIRGTVVLKHYLTTQYRAT